MTTLATASEISRCVACTPGASAEMAVTPQMPVPAEVSSAVRGSAGSGFRQRQRQDEDAGTALPTATSYREVPGDQRGILELACSSPRTYCSF